MIQQGCTTCGAVAWDIEAHKRFHREHDVLMYALTQRWGRRIKLDTAVIVALIGALAAVTAALISR